LISRDILDSDFHYRHIYWKVFCKHLLVDEGHPPSSEPKVTALSFLEVLPLVRATVTPIDICLLFKSVEWLCFHVT
jgi:hypothetical protein